MSDTGFSTPPPGDPQAEAGALADRLAELASRLTEAQRQALVGRLASAGLAGVGSQGSGPLPESPGRELQRALAHGPRDELNAARTVELAAMAADLVLKLDAMMTDIWRKVAPNSTIRKSATLRVTMGRYAAGDEQISRAQVESELALLRQITAGVASAISRAAPQVARKHLDRFGATEIERAVRDEGGGYGLEGKCWKKYQDVCSKLDAEATERELLAIIAEHAEKLIRSTR